MNVDCGSVGRVGRNEKGVEAVLFGIGRSSTSRTTGPESLHVQFPIELEVAFCTSFGLEIVDTIRENGVVSTVVEVLERNG